MSSRASNSEPLAFEGAMPDSPSAALSLHPTEHTTSTASPSLASSGRSSFQSHGRTMSTMPPTHDNLNGPARSNRFSVSFPVQVSRNTSPIRSSQSPVREAHSMVAESFTLVSGPTDANFLTAIAAQERRVLELKEELVKAEAELNKLKRHWTQHEAQRKRDDAKRVTKLQPLQTTLPATEAEDDSDGSNAWMQNEMARRKALLNSNTSSSRTVFSGSRHMRTLSLLSPIAREGSSVGTAPAATRQPPAQPSQRDSGAESGQRGQVIGARDASSSELSRTSTADLAIDGAEIVRTASEEGESGLDRDMFIKTGKKMATDLRDGLLTFFEDLRQVTVGEEATKLEPPARRQSSASNLRAARRKGSKTSLSSRESSSTMTNSADARRPSPPKHSKSATISLASASALADPTFWSQHGILLDQQATPAKVKKSSPAVRHAKSISKVSSIASSDNEAWDTWDESSPFSSRVSSRASESNTVPSSVSNATSPRTSSDMPKMPTWGIHPSADHADSNKKDPIPWPALANLGPKALRRTASHLISAWEESLTPSPSKEPAGHDDYLGLGAEAAAAAAPSDRKTT